MALKNERLLKLNKKFEPPIIDDGDEFFVNGIFEFNITKLLAFIETKPERFPIEQVAVDYISHHKSENLNNETILKADLSEPIILGEISPGRFGVIDGNHRLERARNDGQEQISVRRVFAESHVNFLTSMRSYEMYVKYWNSKISE